MKGDVIMMKTKGRQGRSAGRSAAPPAAEKRGRKARPSRSIAAHDSQSAPVSDAHIQLRQVLAERGMTQSDLSRLIGITRSRMHQVINGDTPPLVLAIILHAHLGIEPYDWFSHRGKLDLMWYLDQGDAQLPRSRLPRKPKHYG